MKQEKNKIQSWLDNLQQESWQLELIISSILLIIIASVEGGIPGLVIKYNSSDGFNFGYVIAILIPLTLFVKTNLIAHIFLRGLWIGCIGLRYISTDINFDSFGYADKFDCFLKKKVLPFDNYIEKLERICSIIFSYFFLMVFHFLSFSILITIIQILNYFAWELVQGRFGEDIIAIFMIVLLVSGILNFIDFITIGKLKKTKYISTLFYPFYLIFNTFSLAFLYRPIHYNFISNKLGRTYMLLMLPYMFLLSIVGNETNFRKYIYIPKKENNSNWVVERNYDNLRKKIFIEHASINKLFYNDNEPIKLFLRVDDNGKTNDLIEKICPAITPYDRADYSVKPFDIMDFRLGDDYYNNTTAKEHNAKVESSLSCISKIYDISIDDTQIPSPGYVFYQHPDSGQQGLLTGISTNELASGKHNLIIKIKRLNNDTVKIGRIIKILFFKN